MLDFFKAMQWATDDFSSFEQIFVQPTSTDKEADAPLNYIAETFMYECEDGSQQAAIPIKQVLRQTYAEMLKDLEEEEKAKKDKMFELL